MTEMNTALMELFLLAIVVLLGIIGTILSVIGWFLRKYAKRVMKRIGELADNQKRHAQQLDTNTAVLHGEEDVPWDGAVEEIKKMSHGVTIAHDRLDRHERSLKRADLLADEYEYSLPDDLDTDRGNKWT